MERGILLCFIDFFTSSVQCNTMLKKSIKQTRNTLSIKQIRSRWPWLQKMTSVVLVRATNVRVSSICSSIRLSLRYFHRSLLAAKESKKNEEAKSRQKRCNLITVLRAQSSIRFYLANLDVRWSCTRMLLCCFYEQIAAISWKVCRNDSSSAVGMIPNTSGSNITPVFVIVLR